VKTKLTITSKEFSYFVDGPETRVANVLNGLLLHFVDLDNLPPGVYTFTVHREGLRIVPDLECIEEHESFKDKLIRTMRDSFHYHLDEEK